MDTLLLNARTVRQQPTGIQNKKIVSKMLTRAAGRKVEPPVTLFLTGTVALLEPEGDSRNG